MLQSIFRGVTVAKVMNPQPVTVPANISLQKLVYEYFLPQGLRSAVVVQGDQPVGLITLSDIRHVPQEQWSQVPVGHIMIPLERLHVVSPEQNLNDVLPLMTGQDVNQLPVVQNGRLVGILSRDAIMRYLEELNRTESVTVLCNLHFLSLARRYATRAVALRSGQLVFDGPPTELDDRRFREIGAWPGSQSPTGCATLPGGRTPGPRLVAPRSRSIFAMSFRNRAMASGCCAATS